MHSDLKFIDLLIKCCASSRARLDFAATFLLAAVPKICKIFTLFCYMRCFWDPLDFPFMGEFMFPRYSNCFSCLYFIFIIKSTLSSLQQSYTTNILQLPPHYSPSDLNLSSASQNALSICDSFSTNSWPVSEHPCPA